MMRLKEKDYGTPIVQSEKTVTGYVDGIEVTVPEGTSISTDRFFASSTRLFSVIQDHLISTFRRSNITYPIAHHIN